MTAPVCLYGYSALEFWRAAPGARATDHPVPDPGCLALPQSGLDVLQKASGLMAPLRLPVETLVSERSARRNANNVRMRYCAIPLPTGSLVRAGRHVLVPTPELCFLQMARALSLHELIQLGFELCGTYAPPAPDTEYLRTRTTPLTTVERMASLVALLPGAAGHKRAMRALEFVRDNARSPMETVSAMLLGLPRRIGGKGLPGMALNYRVDLDRQGQKLAHRSYLLCDLFWPEARLDVEYEGREFHSGEHNMASDKNRANALKHMGVSTISLFDEHMRDEDALDTVVADIARILRFRIRPLTDADRLRTRELRHALFVRPGSAKPAWPGLRADNPLLGDLPVSSYGL